MIGLKYKKISSNYSSLIDFHLVILLLLFYKRRKSLNQKITQQHLIRLFPWNPFPPKSKKELYEKFSFITI